MWAGRKAGGPNITDDLALGDFLPNPNGNFTLVSIIGGISTIVSDFSQVSIATGVPAGKSEYPVANRANGSAHRSGIINGAVTG